jgi:hypothetical protein
MKSLELTKPITTESLLSEFESRFNMTMDLTKFNEHELQDYANHVRTKIHEITQNTHFGQELKDNSYQKSQMMLDIINQAITERKLGEYGGDTGNSILDKATAPIKDKLSKGQALSPEERTAASKLMAMKKMPKGTGTMMGVKEVGEEQSEINEVPGAGLVKRGLRSLGAKAAGAIGMKGTAAGLKGAAQADKKARELYTQLRRYAGQTGGDVDALTVTDLQSFLQKQGYKTDRTPKGPAGKVLNKQQVDDILMKSVQDTFRFQAPATAKSQEKSTMQTDFMKQFKQMASDPATKKKLMSILQGQTVPAESVTENPAMALGRVAAKAAGSAAGTTVANRAMNKLGMKEGVEEQSELILAAKDMMDKVTGYLEDLASMKTEGMLELADRIRDEMGAEKSDAFLQKIQPAIEQAEATLTTTRQELDNGVRILTGEEVASEPMGADDTMDMDTDLDSLDTDMDDTETDEFGASDAEAGGTEPEGREQRESKEVFEASNRLYSKLAGK